MYACTHAFTRACTHASTRIRIQYIIICVEREYFDTTSVHTHTHAHTHTNTIRIYVVRGYFLIQTRKGVISWYQMRKTPESYFTTVTSTAVILKCPGPIFKTIMHVVEFQWSFICLTNRNWDIWYRHFGMNHAVRRRNIVGQCIYLLSLLQPGPLYCDLIL